MSGGEVGGGVGWGREGAARAQGVGSSCNSVPSAGQVCWQKGAGAQTGSSCRRKELEEHSAVGNA